MSQLLVFSLNTILRWQDTILEGSRPLPLSRDEAVSLAGQLTDLATELELARLLLQANLFTNSDFERRVSTQPACLSQCCGSALGSMRIRIQLFITTRLRIRILGAKPMRIHADLDPDPDTSVLVTL
jgi:hypothetical protein